LYLAWHVVMVNGEQFVSKMLAKNVAMGLLGNLNDYQWTITQ